MFTYYDFQRGCDPRTQQTCYIFYCKQTQFGNKRFLLVIWQSERDIAKTLATCCLELLAFFYSDNYYQEVGNNGFHVSQMSSLLATWGERNILNAMTILRLNGLLKYVPLIPANGPDACQIPFIPEGNARRDASKLTA
ncbi:hypothetical protein [Oscillatoria sp. FACHB-1406]|uniref:hypothetical protein n=1 Tax=Oscillatoria sp. FACHB-1406 TaxID=2692846 RepID=UPI00168595ED|nr:hypothetical protein [Oscillatoria sp. FACHB-1406]MBD2576782.1 hypothetical protein [Oscillatoria sp. FACHB-1406]